MKKIYKIVFLGNTSVGKTTLISQYLYSKVHTPTPTIGIDFLSTTYEINGQSVKLQLWDTAGQERFHSIIGNYTRNTFIAIIVFSVDNVASVEKLKLWIDDFVLTHNHKENVNLIVVANKIDKGIIDQNIINEGRSIAEQYDAKFVVTSAIEKKDIEEMVFAINEFIISDLSKTDSEDESSSNKIILKVKNRRCC